ncbi:hydroquinone glucosyltransferase-like [Senna tora]|uniref:Glycosyltransferase n=1 Tax=Senna tora TaxID=362788 RepID=A0A834WHY3_9FABA|nr:hydroquinone glucosyltransferase-like [Senna tora]
MAKITHIVIVPSPLYSHLVSALELSKRLLHLHPTFHVTCIIPILESLPPSFIPNLQSLPPNLTTVFLPSISKDDMPTGAKEVVKIKLTITKSMPSIHGLLNSFTSKTPLAALIADPFSHEVLESSKALNTLSFIFLPASAMIVSFLFHMPKLDQTLVGDFHQQSQGIHIPGCVPLRGSDLPDPLQDRSNRAYKEYLQRAESFSRVDGVLVNSFLELEQGPARALVEQGSNHPPVYLVGPLTQSGSKPGSDSDSECLKWLENQPPRSVLYICFGAGGTLTSQTQINELASGLELSGKRFLWVVRVPSDSVDISLGSSKKTNPLECLPKGFLERTKDQGLVIPLWAPQISILSHKSTGGFLTNGGWNSILESVQYGVPIIAWPLFAEQRMNAAFLTDGLNVALRPKVNQSGIVDREEIGAVIKRLMEGEEGKEIYRRMSGLKDVAVSVLKEGGSSTKALNEVAQICKTFQ